MTTTTIDAPTDTDIQTLTAADRCDNCGARAYATAAFPIMTDNGPKTSELNFCAHHFRKYEAKLEARALTVLDETRFLIGSRAGM